MTKTLTDWSRYSDRFARRDTNRQASAEVFTAVNTNGNRYWQVIRNPDGLVIANGWRLSVKDAKADATRALNAYLARLERVKR